MSCHTWIFKKISSFPKKELDNMIKAEYENYLEWNSYDNVAGKSGFVQESDYWFDRIIEERVKKFCASEEYNYKEFYEIILNLNRGLGLNVAIYNDDYYVTHSVDKLFIGNKPIGFGQYIDNVDDMIDYLRKYNGDVLSGDLQERIVDLFKDNDIIIHVG